MNFAIARENFRENTKEWYVIGIFLFIISFFALANIPVFELGGSMVKNSNLNKKNNFFSRAELEVKKFKKQGFMSGEKLALIVPLENGVTVGELNRLIEIHKLVEENFFGIGIESLVNVTRQGPNVLMGSFQVSKEEIESKSFSIQDWKKELKRDSSSMNLLVGTDFDYFQIILHMSDDYDEIKFRNQLAELLENRTIPNFYWSIIKTNIEPTGKFKGVLTKSWGIARSLLSSLLCVGIALFSVVAIFFSMFLIYPATRSKRQTAYCLGIMISSLIVIRGTIGVCYWLDITLFDEFIKERVYIMLAFSVGILNGNSFPIRILDSYGIVKKNNCNLRPREVWAMTSIDEFNFIGNVAILGFATMYATINRGLTEFGILASVGIIFLLFASKSFLPALQIVFGGESKKQEESRLLRTVSSYLKLSVKFLHSLQTIFSPWKTFWIAFAFLSIFVGGASFIVVHDCIHYSKGDYLKTHIETGTSPLPYFPEDNIITVSSKYANKEGRSGFGSLSFFVPGDIYDPDFIGDFYQKMKKIEEIEGARGVKSVVGRILYYFDGKLPKSRTELEEVFFLAEMDYSPLIIRNSYCEKGISFDVLVPASNSNKIEFKATEVIRIMDLATYNKVFVEKISIADLDWENVKCLPYGRLHEYHQSDRNIQKKQPVNMVSSIGMVAVCCIFWVRIGNLIFKKKEDENNFYGLVWFFFLILIYGIVLNLIPGASAVKIWGVFSFVLMGLGVVIYKRMNKLTSFEEGQVYFLSSVKTGCAMTVPYLFAFSCVVYLLAFTGMPLDQAMVCIAPIAVNAAIDFNVHFVNHFKDALKKGAGFREALYIPLCKKGEINIVDIVNNAFVFSFLIISDIGPINLNGKMLSSLMFVCGFGALVIMPALLFKCLELVPVKVFEIEKGV